MYFVSLCRLMRHDFVGVSEIVESAYTHRFGGMAMPASRFIQIYEWGLETSNSTDRFRLRREIRNYAIRDCIDKFHKYVQSK